MLDKRRRRWPSIDTTLAQYRVYWDSIFQYVTCNAYMNIWILLYVAFCPIMAISRQKEARSRDFALLLFRMTSRVLYSAQYHRQHCSLHTFEQFGALHMHNHDDNYPTRPGFEPGNPRLQAPVDTNEPSGPATCNATTVLEFKGKME